MIRQKIIITMNYFKTSILFIDSNGNLIKTIKIKDLQNNKKRFHNLYIDKPEVSK